MITTLRITGMTCNGCARHVNAALREVPGVTAVEVNLVEHQARVAHEDAARVTDLVAAIEAAGYQAST